jgi:hypothetical protein
VLATATGGLLATAMAGSPTARADDPFTDISNDVQSSITAGEADYTAAGTDFSTAAGTTAGLESEFAGFDNLFISPTDYTLLGLTAAGTGTDFSGYGSTFFVDSGDFTSASTDLAIAQSDYSDAASALTSNDDFLATAYLLLGGYEDILAGQADTLSGLISLGF